MQCATAAGGYHESLPDLTGQTSSVDKWRWKPRSCRSCLQLLCWHSQSSAICFSCSVSLLFRHYHMTVFISAHMSCPSVNNCPRHSRGHLWPKAWYRADTKTAIDNIFVIWLNLPILQWSNYYICHNSLLKYAESNWWMTDRLLWCLYSASTSCNNQSETSVATHDIQKFRTKLHFIEALALISAPGIFIYYGPLLMITARC